MLRSRFGRRKYVRCDRHGEALAHPKSVPDRTSGRTDEEQSISTVNGPMPRTRSADRLLLVAQAAIPAAVGICIANARAERSLTASIWRWRAGATSSSGAPPAIPVGRAAAAPEGADRRRCCGGAAVQLR